MRFVLVVSFGFLTASAALADDVGTAFTYQGELLDGGSPVGTPTPVDCEFEFTLWDMAVGGTQIGPTLPTGAVVSNGRFTVALDFGDDRFQGSQRFLQIQVCCPLSCAPAGLVPLNPRQELTPAPYALALPGLYTRQHPSSPNLIGGFSGNIVEVGAAASTIGGGGSAGAENRVLDSGGTVGGGSGNTAGSNDANPASAQLATVGGGSNNEAVAVNATVGGGNSNQAGGSFSTIAGGWFNFAFDGLGTVGGGGNNTAGGLNSTVGGGGGMNAADGNTASGINSAVGGGQSNIAGGDHATVAGGLSNQTSAVRATISGGRDNNVSAGSATIAGGSTNSATDNFGTVGGGAGNRAGDNDADPATAAYATVAGGDSNIAEGFASTVAGGQSNTAAQFAATVGGGFGNQASEFESTVAGGDSNTASGPISTIGGGGSNTALGFLSTVSGGENNNADVDFATIGGGSENRVTGTSGTIGGGGFNTAGGNASTVPGGQDNTAAGDFSFAAGQRAQASHNSSFVWSDSTTVSPSFFSSTAPNQFLINAAGGVGIGTNAPTSELHVKGVQAMITLQDDGDPASFTELADTDVSQFVLDKFSSTGSSVIDLNPRPLDAVGTAKLRIFRETNTSGVKQVQFHRGNNTTQVSAMIGVDGSDSYFQAHGGNVGIGTTTPGAKLHVGGTSGVDGIMFPDGTLQTTAATGGGGGFWSASGADIFNSNAGDVGIGLSNPLEKLDVDGTGQFRQGLAVLANPGTFNSDCCSSHGGAGGCDNPTCQSAVCAAESTCCNFSGWSLACADLARDLCENICDPVFLPGNSVSDRERTPINLTELPQITANELANEPGVAGNLGSDLETDLTGGVEVLVSSSIDPPSSGWVLAIGSFAVMLNHTGGALTRGRFGVSDVSTAFPVNQDKLIQIGIQNPSTINRRSVTVHGLFAVTGAPQTFYLLGIEDFGDLKFLEAQLTLVFIPTAYGTVAPNARSAGAAGFGGDSKTQLIIDQDGLAAFEGGPREFADGPVKVAESQPMSPADIEHELASLRARMEDRMTMLEQQLADLGQTGGEEE